MNKGNALTTLLIAGAVALLFLWQGAAAEEGGFRLLGFTFGSGGPSAGGDYRAQIVLGDTSGGRSSSGDYTLISGFGGVILNVTHTPTYTPTHTPTFTQTPTHTPTSTPTPTRLSDTNGYDPYEPDNTCAQAQHIPLAALPQEHTFHKAADVDWAKVDVIEGQRYRIDAYVPDGSPADVVLEPYAECDEPFGTPWNEPFARDATLEFDALTTGPVYIRLTNNDAGIGGSHVRYSLSARSLVEDKTGALIIVGGRYRTNDSLQSNINRVTGDVYELFLAKNYTDDDIYYISADTSVTGWDASATVTNLRSAITNWAVSKVGPDRALTLYLMDHGDRDAFFLDNPYGEVLTPTLLRGWLSQLESAVPGVKINVVIEACYAGSFIEGGDSISKAGRLVITSTSANNAAYASQNGADFSDRFLVGLWQNKDVFQSFVEAQLSVKGIRSIQDPWLDANGNGIPNELEDMLIARQRGFQNPGSFDDRWPPLIYTATGPQQITNRRGVIEAEVRLPPFKQIQSVWAVVYPPSYAPPEPGAELIPEPDSSLLLAHQGNGIYRATYAGFDEAGLYRIVVYAQDRDGLNARPVVVDAQNGYPLFLPQLQR
ncbi:MAG: hypothetical protein KJZ86_03260 [Caldilineaceae bacterium]|nr:hypothetical protein [Caldilineaceae bacterium]